MEFIKLGFYSIVFRWQLPYNHKQSKSILKLLVMLNTYFKTAFIASGVLISSLASAALNKGDLLYQNTLSTADSVSEWQMEGPGKITFNNNWLQMFSPDEEMHHVFWCPKEFPESFIAEWQVQNLKFDADAKIGSLMTNAMAADDLVRMVFMCIFLATLVSLS